MTLHLYDTATRAMRPFVPLEPGKASIYLCGATVQAPPHIGHVRSGVNFDILRRWLEHLGYAVTFVRNVTDIDDKILARAAEEGVPFWQIATRNERAFGEAYDVLNCLPPSVEPRATGHVPEMVVLMRRLLDSGHAYAAGGDVYFDVGSFPAYGSLSGQKLDSMLAAGDTDPAAEQRKRDVRDFALWKGAKPGEPAWETPWGPGRPGWHLECSAMAERYLGAVFDIHGGGLDLVFPHHENEIAQSVAAGDEFARYWMHNAWVTTGGEKMSKSLGNFLLVSEVVKRVRPVELRYYLGAAHYRSHIEYSEPALQEAASGYRRIEGFLKRAGDALSGVRGDVRGDVDGLTDGLGTVPDGFAAAMNDDLATPHALAVLHETVRHGNSLLAAGDCGDELAQTRAAVAAMLGVLGLDPADYAAGGEQHQLTAVVDALVAVALEQRSAARARKDYAAADAIRDRLAAAGVVVEDTPAGPRWSLQEQVSS